MALLLSQRFDLPSIVGELLAERGVDVEDVERYLTPKYQNCSQIHFNSLIWISRRKIKRALQPKKKYGAGDYDVDGATSSAFYLGFLGTLVPRSIFIWNV